MALIGQGAAFRREGLRRIESYHDELAVDVLDAVQAVVFLALAQGVGVDVGGEVADGGADALVEGAAEGEVASKAHSGGALMSRESQCENRPILEIQM